MTAPHIAAHPVPDPAPRPEPGRSGSGRSAIGRVACLAALLLLTIGVPMLLLWLAGPLPVPRSLPGRDALTARVGIEAVITTLVAVVWLAWLHFMICVAVEVVAAVRGGVLARPLPLSGPSQRLARLLVAGALLSSTLVVTVGSTAQAVTAAAAGRPQVSAVTAVLVPAAPPPVAADHPAAGRPGPAAELLAAGRPGEAVPARAVPDLDLPEHRLAELDGRKVYVVEAPSGRHHDSLWEIAERHLGDGRRYREIFELNSSRPQPDGRTLHLARLIQPGWRLEMPEDAVGVERFVASHYQQPDAGSARGEAAEARDTGSGTEAAAPTSAPREPATQTPKASAGEADPAAAAPRPVTTHRQVLPTTPAAPAPRGDVEVPDLQLKSADFPGLPVPTVGDLVGDAVRGELLGAGLLGAGLLGTLMLVRRRRQGGPAPDAEAAEAEVWLRAGADTDRGGSLDRALRAIRGHCAEAGMALPQVFGAVVDAGTIDLLLTMPRATAPPPWTASADGMRWRLPHDVRAEFLVGDESAYPLMASVGRDTGGRDALLNLDAAAGPIAVTGHLPTAAAVVRALTLGLAGNPWSRGIEVLIADLPAALPAIAAGRLTVCAAADPLIDLLQDSGGPVARTRPAEILTGGPAPGSRPERVAVFGAPLNAAAADRLQAAIGRRPEVAVLVTGELLGARWRLDVTEDGELSCAELGLRVQANRLGDVSVERLHALFTTAATPFSRMVRSDVERRGALAAVGPSAGSPVEDVADRGSAEDSVEADGSPGTEGSVGAAGPGRKAGTGVPDRRAGDSPGLRGVPVRQLPGPVPDVDDASWAQARVRVALLGEVQVDVRDGEEAERVAEDRPEVLREVTAFLALNRDGVHPAVLGSAIWPRGVTADVRDATMERAQAWLGTDGEGRPLISSGPDGRWRLSTAVPADWDVLRTLLDRAAAGSGPAQERELLVRALHLVRGPLAGGVPDGSYSWLAATGVEARAEALVVTAARRLVRLSLADGDPAAASGAAAAGLRAGPAVQSLWRDLLRAEYATGGAERLGPAVEHLRFSLATSGVDLEPETSALIDHLTQSAAPSGTAASTRATAGPASWHARGQDQRWSGPAA